MDVWHLEFVLILSLLVTLLLSHFSCVRLCATPSLGFSRQEHWSGLPFPSPVHKSESEVAQSCLILSDCMDCSLPGSSVHGIFQARVLEWGAIAIILLENIGKDYLGLTLKTSWYQGLDISLLMGSVQNLGCSKSY